MALVVHIKVFRRHPLGNDSTLAGMVRAELLAVLEAGVVARAGEGDAMDQTQKIALVCSC